jgi:glycosyltransferase involved in cell wall biosynthesis
VIATAAAGLSVVIEDGVDGRIVAAGDIGAMADALTDFHRRPDLARRLGARAAARVAESFTWERVVESYESLYDEVLGLASFVPGGARPSR